LNEAATAAFRLHTLCRDLFSRCTYDATLIDQLWFHAISNKVKYVYDMKANGVDALLCGSLWDYGFAGDANFAHQYHHRLFETTTKYGETRRNDLVAINIARGREHGLDHYNVYRKLCGFPAAYTFEDFSDTINYEGIQKLKQLYKDPNDVELFPGLSLEDRVLGGLVGPVSACILNTQFYNLKYGDRFFYSHVGVFTPEQLEAITSYPPYCFVCQVVHIKEVSKNIFESPDDYTNPLLKCDQCPEFDWSKFMSTTY